MGQFRLTILRSSIASTAKVAVAPSASAAVAVLFCGPGATGISFERGRAATAASNGKTEARKCIMCTKQWAVLVMLSEPWLGSMQEAKKVLERLVGSEEASST